MTSHCQSKRYCTSPFGNGNVEKKWAELSRLAASSLALRQPGTLPQGWEEHNRMACRQHGADSALPEKINSDLMTGYFAAQKISGIAPDCIKWIEIMLHFCRC